jgi:hypothetical protein
MEITEAIYVFRLTNNLSHRNKRDEQLYSSLKNEAHMHLITHSNLEAFKKYLKTLADTADAAHPRCKKISFDIYNNSIRSEGVSYDGGHISGVIETIVDQYLPA